MDLTSKTELSTVRRQLLWIFMHSEYWGQGETGVFLEQVFIGCPLLFSVMFNASHTHSL